MMKVSSDTLILLLVFPVPLSQLFIPPETDLPLPLSLLNKRGIGESVILFKLPKILCYDR